MLWIVAEAGQARHCLAQPLQRDRSHKRPEMWLADRQLLWSQASGSAAAGKGLFRF